jgi:hypothetical protein
MATRRLHRAGIAVYALAALRQNLLPLAVVFGISVLGGGGLDAAALLRGAFFGLFAAVVAAVVGFV